MKFSEEKHNMKYWYFLFFTCVLFSQNDSINLLDEVKIYGNFSPRINAGFQIKILNDSILNNQQQSLGNLLQNKANLYFKQNGNGMVSSISLRGSGASNTGVYWNGIAINSSLNGQTDFNTITANGYDQIEIRKGSGSVLFGSGAIGGAINLSDKIFFEKKKKINLNLGYGSFKTLSLALNTTLSNDNVYVKFAVNGEQSENDYPYPNSNLVNENGAYKNYHLKGVFAYKLNNQNQIHLHTTYSNNDRNFSRTLVAPNNSKYKNENSRMMLNWRNFGLKYNSSLKLVFINENYKFFLNKDNDNFSIGKTNNYLTKYDFKYFLNKNTTVISGIENRFTKGNGTNIQDKDRNNLEFYLLLNKQINHKLIYNLSARQGFSSVYKVPFIYTIDAKYLISNTFSIRGNFGTNFKLPTFNDLFWEASGNEDLLPEKSISTEFGFDFNLKKSTISLTSYYTKSKDLIQWRPVTSVFWRPVNVQNVASYGVEFGFETYKNFGKHRFEFLAQYAYSFSEDTELEKQLIYVPYHKANATLNYNYKEWSLNFNQQFNGSVFTTTSNTKTVEEFLLTNLQIHKTFLHKKISTGLIVDNLFDINYQTVSFRPMPNRNYSIQLTLNY